MRRKSITSKKRGKIYDNESWLEILVERTKFFVTILACLIADSFFIFIWLLIHWELHDLIERFQLAGFDYWIGVFLRCVLEIPVLVTTIVFAIVDINKISERLITGSKKSLRTRKVKPELVDATTTFIDLEQEEIVNSRVD